MKDFEKKQPKTPKELDALNKEATNLNNEVVELTEAELLQVVGGEEEPP